MTDTAIILRRDMVGDLRCRDTGRVAGCAVVGINTKMVVGDTGKSREVIGQMTRRAISVCRYMGRRLSERDVAVMTLRTVVNIDTLVTERSRYKGRHSMAGITVCCRRQMVVELAYADDVVVAGITASSTNIGMIIDTGTEGTRRVAVLAILGTDRHVLIERRAQRYTGRIDTIVTVVATLRQNSRIVVIDAERRNEALSAVAGSTI